jgi:hypothetical protein
MAGGDRTRVRQAPPGAGTSGESNQTWIQVGVN